jgi:acyl-CoA thioesterase
MPRKGPSAMSEIDQGPAMDPQTLAEVATEAMFSRDHASQALGMRVARVGPGQADLTMTVRPDMLDGRGTCHRGFIFALADSTFSLASNSHNQNAVASGCMIDFLAPCGVGEVLRAEAVEQSLSGRSGLYDITVTNQDGERVALFRGKSTRLKGEVINDLVLQFL